jgi:Domain of unknown function (DUF3067)
MRSLMLSKYGKQYDVSFVRRDVPGMKTFVCLNIMWLHLEMTSFKMSEAQYQEKLDSAAALVNALGQTDKVRFALCLLLQSRLVHVAMPHTKCSVFKPVHVCHAACCRCVLSYGRRHAVKRGFHAGQLWELRSAYASTWTKLSLTSGLGRAMTDRKEL